MTASGMSVLLIDNDPHMCGILELIFGYYDIPVCVVTQTAEILDNPAHYVASVVLIELFLPEMDGYTLMKHLKAAGYLNKAKFVATTAFYTNDTSQEMLQRGFDGFVSKPFDVTELVPYLRRLVEGPGDDD